MTYTLVDTARVGYDMQAVEQLATVSFSLYRGPEDAQQADMAPTLVGYEAGDAMAGWLDARWGQSVGIGIDTRATPDELRKHLRRFLIVQFEGEDRIVYFRYYDPNILRVFLPTCDAEQLTNFFGPIQAFRVEDVEQKTDLTFTLQQGRLVTQATLPHHLA